MEKIQNQKYDLETLFYCLSRMLERGSYYGLRSLLVIYMTSEIMTMDTAAAIQIFGWITVAIVVTQVIGALLGDLLIGNKRSIIIGGIIQALGAFVLCISSNIGLYTGLFLVVLGTGLFTPNIISNYGKTYLHKTKLLDAGFTIFYMAVNLGSIVGIALIGYMGDEFGYSAGFIICGVMTLLSIIPIFITKEKELPQGPSISIGRRIITIFLAIVLVAMFWGVYEIALIRIYDIQMQLSEVSTLDIPQSIWQSLNASLTIPVGIVAILIWTFYYNSQFFKLLIGFIFGALALGLILFIPEFPGEQHSFLYFAALLMYAISEIHIAPIVHSILTQYSNPKYLAILVSLAFIPAHIVAFLFGLFNERFYNEPSLGITVGLVLTILISLGIVGYIIIDKIMSQKKSA